MKMPCITPPADIHELRIFANDLVILVGLPSSANKSPNPTSRMIGPSKSPYLRNSSADTLTTPKRKEEA